MSVCEKCWRDAGGNHEAYLLLLKEREDDPCTAQEEEGLDVGVDLEALERIATALEYIADHFREPRQL